jgi:DnaJ-domain-containing protein 1
MTASTQKRSKFEELILQQQDPSGLAVLMILSWISTSDGHIDEREKQALLSIAKSGGHTQCANFILKLALQVNIPAIQLACEIIRVRFAGNEADLFMEMAIGIAIADRHLYPAENHILRLLGDLLGISKIRLNYLFSEITGKPLPDAPDVSSRQYWESKKNTNKGTTHEQSNSSGQSSENAGSHSSQGRSKSTARPRKANRYEEAHDTIGIPRGATKQEIKTAYRRLAKVHHPDRFHSLGKEAVEAAHTTFTRIQDAYSYLTSYA